MKIDVRDLPTYYINMDTEKGKIKGTQTALETAGIKDINRVSAVISPVKKLGCSGSHYKILNNKDIKVPFFIAEDDIVYTGASLELEIPDDADGLYLGPTQWGRYLDHIGPFCHFRKTGFNNIVRVYNMLMTHAIVYLNEEFRDHCRRIAKLSSEGKYHIDQGFAEAQRVYNVYSVDAPVFSQNGWNLQVTKDTLTETAIDIERSKQIFDVCSKDHSQLVNVPDLTGVSKSKYYPMGYDGIGISMKPGRGG
jgi:hypothetical protein